MKSLSPQEKQINIRTKALERFQKDYISYEKELEKEKTKHEVMKAAEKCPNDINKQEEIIAETLTVLHDVKSRLIKEKENVIKLLDDVEDESLRQSEQFKRSETVIAQIEKFIDEHILNK
jgi:hypothetical protein